MCHSTTDQIRNLNDAFRTSLEGGQILMTSGVADREPAFALKALAAVRSFNTFTEGNDLYREHDFGAIVIEGERLFWKIDYYDLGLENASSDPSDPSQTRRVLTIMLADEY